MTAENEVHALCKERILKEVFWVNQNTSSRATYIEQEDGKRYVLYENIETSCKENGLPEVTDVLTTIPEGYPGVFIDMPALPLGSPLLSRVVGGSNPQHTVVVNGKQWKFVSFHPYQNGGGPAWNPNELGFHDYYNQLYIWLHRLK